MTSYHGWTHAPKELGGTDPIPGIGSDLIARAVLYGGAGDIYASAGMVPVRFDSAYILDPTTEVFQLNTTSLGDPDLMNRYQLQLLKTKGLYRVECVVGIDDSTFTEAGAAWLYTNVGQNNTMVDYQRFIASDTHPAGPFMRTIGHFDAGAVWAHDGELAPALVNPTFGHSFPTIELGWDTMYLKVEYLGDTGNVNAAPWVSSFLP